MQMILAMISRSRLAAAACGLAALSTITACGTAATPASTPAESTPATASTPSPRRTVEAAGPTPRLAITHDGGVQVIDATTGTTVGDFPLEGFTRLNQAGDGRRLLVTEGDSFRMLDM